MSLLDLRNLRREVFYVTFTIFLRVSANWPSCGRPFRVMMVLNLFALNSSRVLSCIARLV